MFLGRLAGVEPAISALATQRLTARLQPLVQLAPGGGFEPDPSVVSKTTVLPLDDPGTFSSLFGETHFTCPCQALCRHIYELAGEQGFEP